MPTKCCWVIHGSLTSERKASTSPSSFINHSTLLLNRALKRQAPCLCMHFEVRARALDRLKTRRRVGSTRRRGNHMHDHSRFQRDINDVTGVSLSLSTSHKKSLTHNIGSASALPIITLAPSHGCHLTSILTLSRSLSHKHTDTHTHTHTHTLSLSLSLSLSLFLTLFSRCFPYTLHIHLALYTSPLSAIGFE